MILDSFHLSFGDFSRSAAGQGTNAKTIRMHEIKHLHLILSYTLQPINYKVLVVVFIIIVHMLLFYLDLHYVENDVKFILCKIAAELDLFKKLK